MLTALAKHNIKAILLNGRMSERSYHRWKFLKAGAKRLLGVFVLALTQTGGDRNRYAALGMTNVHAIGNLKFAADPLPCETETLATLKGSLTNRPVWLMASTHPGEEEIAIRTHRKIHRILPNLLTIIAPRHPTRSAEICELLVKEKIAYAQRAKGELPKTSTQIYLADTLGELGLFYRLCRVCCLAGSFTWGGHNPIEPALLHCAVVFGPKMDNFIVMADEMLAQKAAIQVLGEDELGDTILHLLESPSMAEEFSASAKKWANSKQGILDKTLEMIEPFFGERT
jgi:3-deoxy-D-manno-octulosonic-acid transferase